MKLRNILLVALVTLLVSVSFAEAEKDLDRLKLGDGWLNAIPINEFAGRVIVVELWGIN